MAHKVTVNVNNTNLPNGFYYQAGQSAVLSDEEFAQLNPLSYTPTNLGTLATALVAGTVVAEVSLGSLSVNVNPGEQFTLTDSGHTQTFTVSYAVTATASSVNIPVEPANPTYSFTTAATAGLVTPLTDNGVVGVGGDQVTTQGSTVAAPAALTSAQVTAAPTEAEFNALQADVAALWTTVNNLVTNLSGQGKALA